MTGNSLTVNMRHLFLIPDSILFSPALSHNIRNASPYSPLLPYHMEQTAGAGTLLFSSPSFTILSFPLLPLFMTTLLAPNYDGRRLFFSAYSR
jgi:hypothetical protein